MFDAIFFVCNDRRKIYIFNTLKNITFHIWIHPFQSLDQFLDLNTLRLIFLIITSCTGVGKLAGALDKVCLLYTSDAADDV